MFKECFFCTWNIWVNFPLPCGFSLQRNKFMVILSILHRHCAFITLVFNKTNDLKAGCNHLASLGIVWREDSLQHFPVETYLVFLLYAWIWLVLSGWGKKKKKKKKLCDFHWFKRKWIHLKEWMGIQSLDWQVILTVSWSGGFTSPTSLRPVLLILILFPPHLPIQ